MTTSTDRRETFFEETRELLAKLEQNLLLLEQDETNDYTLIDEIFRTVHSIKGGADYLGLSNLKDLAHAMEDALDLFRKNILDLTRDAITTFLVASDCIKEMLNSPDSMSTIDISQLLMDIGSLSKHDNSPDNEDKLGDQCIRLGIPSRPTLFTKTQENVRALLSGNFKLYIFSITDITNQYSISDFESFLTELLSLGYFVDSNHTHGENKSDSKQEDLDNTVNILFRSVLSRTALLQYLNVDPKLIYEVKGLDEFHIDTQNKTQSISGKDPNFSMSRKDNTRDHTSNGIVKDNNIDPITYNELPKEFLSIPGTSAGENEDKKQTGNQSVRVNVDILDKLMNLVGELVLTRNQLNQNVDLNDHIGTALTAQRLDIVTTELQESVMATRMQPLGNVLTKFHRVIRDMSNQLHKSLNLVLEGEDVELDKTIIENISDPLTHLVRNAIDHGIERPDERRRKNKPEVATLSITAKQEAAHVVIEIKDDGRGIDIEKVKAKAIKKGILDETKIGEISDKELLKIIFTPGFTTAESVTDISGRGVGLDVVFTNISKLGGLVDVESVENAGTTFKVSLPLTLAIVPSLLVSSQGETFAIPQINLVELVRVPQNQSSSRIETLGDSTVIRLRDKLLPIVWIDKVLNLETKNNSQDGSTNIAVVSSGEYCYGIVVDYFTDSEEIVVKPLGKHLQGCQVYASATILGDGNAALILDINGIAQALNIPNLTDLNTEAGTGVDKDALYEKALNYIGQEQSLLVVENANGDCFGIELAYVNRIERILHRSIETFDHKNIIKYRGGVLRIFDLNEATESNEDCTPDNYVYLVVFYMMGTEVAIMVSNIVDIVDNWTQVDSTAVSAAGVKGSTIIMDRITMLLDLFELVKVIDPALKLDESSKHTINSNTLSQSKNDKATVLVVEDSVFFQDKLDVLLKDMNLNVMMAADGQAGWDMLNDHADNIDLVLMDIEMPKLTGLELSRLIRSDGRFADLPIVMLTSLAKQADVEEGKKAGANEYLIKMDQEMVKHTINNYIDRGPFLKAG